MIVCSVADKNETRTLPDLPIAARATGRPCGGALSAGVDGGGSLVLHRNFVAAAISNCVTFHRAFRTSSSATRAATAS
jgi:hypothetical protein